MNTCTCSGALQPFLEGFVVTISDLGSRNGVFLNRVRLDPAVRYPLVHFDQISLGSPRGRTFVYHAAAGGEEPSFSVLDSLDCEGDLFQQPRKKRKSSHGSSQVEDQEFCSSEGGWEVGETQMFPSALDSSDVRERLIASEDHRSELNRQVLDLSRAVDEAVRIFRDMNIRRLAFHAPGRKRPNSSRLPLERLSPRPASNPTQLLNGDHLVWERLGALSEKACPGCDRSCSKSLPIPMALMPVTNRRSAGLDPVVLADRDEIFFAGRPRYFAANFCHLFRLHQKLPKPCRQFAAIVKDGHPVHHYADLDFSYTSESEISEWFRDVQVVHQAYEKLFVRFFLAVLGRPPKSPVRFLHLQASYPPTSDRRKGKFSAHIHCVSEGFANLRVLNTFNMLFDEFVKRQADGEDPDALALTQPHHFQDREKVLLSDPSVRHRNSLLRCWGSSKPGGRPLERFHLPTDAPHLVHGGDSRPSQEGGSVSSLGQTWAAKVEAFFDLRSAGLPPEKPRLSQWDEDVLSLFFSLPTYAFLNGITVQAHDLQSALQHHAVHRQQIPLYMSVEQHGNHRQSTAAEPQPHAPTMISLRPRYPRSFRFLLDVHSLGRLRKQDICRHLTSCTNLAQHRAHTYDMWLRLCFIIHREFEGSRDGLQLFLECSRKSPKWDGEACCQLYYSVKPRAPGLSVVTIMTLIHWALHDNFAGTTAYLVSEGIVEFADEGSTTQPDGDKIKNRED